MSAAPARLAVVVDVGVVVKGGGDMIFGCWLLLVVVVVVMLLLKLVLELLLRCRKSHIETRERASQVCVAKA